MLTGDLIRVKVVKKELKPSFIQPSSPRLLDRANELVQMLGHALEDGWTRGRIDEEVRSITGLSTAGVYAAQADMEFPREIRLGQSAQVWMNSDVQKWIEERGGS